MKRPIIAITGSNGKTTTKEMLASILKQRWNTFKSIANGNDVWYTEQYSKEINRTHEAIVLEYALCQPNDIGRCCQIIQPNISIITNIGHERIGSYDGKIEGTAREKSQIISGMEADGLLFLNADDEYSKLLTTNEFKGKLMKVSIHRNKADYHAHGIEYLNHGMSFKVTLDGVQHDFSIPIWGEHNVRNALFAIAVSHNLGITPAEMKIGLLQYEKAQHRLYPYHINNITIIDDTFNASPESMTAALDVLEKVGAGIKTVVLGSIARLGCYSVTGHKGIGKYLAQKKIDYLLTYDEEAKLIGEGAIENGFPPQHIAHAATRQELHYQLFIAEHKNQIGTILFKGANNLNLYKSVHFLYNRYKLKQDFRATILPRILTR